MTSPGRQTCFVVVEGYYTLSRSLYPATRAVVEEARLGCSLVGATVTSRRRRRRRWCAGLPLRVISTSHTPCTRVHRHHRDGGATSARHVAPHPRGEAHHRGCFNAPKGGGGAGSWDYEVGDHAHYHTFPQFSMTRGHVRLLASLLSPRDFNQLNISYLIYDTSLESSIEK